MKKWYRVLAIVLVFVCLLEDLSVAKGNTKAAQEVTKSTLAMAEVLEPTQIPSVTEIPEPTQIPSVTEIPESTLVPSATETPEPTQIPSVTEIPEPTQIPSVTETPKPTQVPSITEEPEPAQKPRKLILKISQKKRKITLRWNSLEAASSYLIYTKESGKKYRKKTVKKGTAYSFTVEYGKTYYVRMVARNKKKIVFKTKSYQIYVPVKLNSVHTISQEKKCVKLIWNAVPKTTSYYVYRRGVQEETFTLLGKRKKNSYIDDTLSYNKNYQYKIVPVTKRSGYFYRGKGGYKLFSNKKLVNTTRQKYRYTDMEEDIRALKKKYYGLIQTKVIGKSEDGRKLYDVILGNPDASKAILVVAAIHGREYMTSLLCMNQIEYYLENYQGELAGTKVKATLKKIAIHIIPMANPDGVTISQDGIQGIESSALRTKLYRISDGNTALWKANARGVDLNQNFPYHFKKHGKAGSENYSGKKAASESETKALRKLLSGLKKQGGLKGVINYHATGSILFGSCKKKGVVKEKTQEMYELARTITGYADSASYEKQHQGSGSGGGLREYILYKKKLPSITLEIGWNPCPVPIKEFETIWEKNRNLVYRQALLFLWSKITVSK